MNKINEKLKKIFDRKDFRDNDIVEFEHLDKTEKWKVLYKPKNSTLTRDEE